MDSQFISIIVMVLCIVLSGFFSATETAFSSVNKIKMISLSENGNKKAARVLELLENFDNFISTVLIGNNVVNILLTSLTTALFITLVGSYGTTLSTVVTTLVVLLFGEIAPKTMAKRAPENFAMVALPIMEFFIVILTPFTFVFSLWTKMLSKIGNNTEDSSITDDELLTIVNEAHSEGGIDEYESELIKKAIVFDDSQAGDILTPRVDIIAVPTDATDEEITEVFSESGYTRIPVYEGTLDNIVGIIHQKDYYESVIEGGKPLSEVIQKAMFVAPSMKISLLLRELQTQKEHLAVVVDEYGGTAGLVTMEDILEELVGEIWDEHDEVVEDIEEVGADTYIVQGTLPIDEMLEFFHVKCEETEADTVSGWVMEQMGKIPEERDSFEYMNLAIEIEEIVNRRITKVKIIKYPVPEDEAEKDEKNSKDSKDKEKIKK